MLEPWIPPGDILREAKMRGVWLGAVVLFLLVLSPALALADLYVISDFEGEADLANWGAWGCVDPCPDPGAPMPAIPSLYAGYATDGSYSCRLELPAADYPGLYLSTFPMNDWSAYDVVRLDVYNPNSFAVTINLEMGDSQTGWQKRYDSGRAIIPGLNHLEVDLHTLARNDGSGNVEPADIQHFSFWFAGYSSTIFVYMDYVRLETVHDDPGADAARNIWKFDFGTATSPRWRDFFRVTESDSDNYPVDPTTMPSGWVYSQADQIRVSGDYGGPDDMTRDFVRGIPCSNVCYPGDSDLDFRVDVPNDSYTVYVITRSGNPSAMPVRNWQVWAEGALQVDVPMDSGTFYSTSYYYRGMDEDYPLSRSAWEQFENANFPAYSFTTGVTDGSLDLHFVQCWLYALIVYPTDLAGEMSTRIADWEAQRQVQFETAYYINAPQDLTFTPTGEEALRGYAAWPVATMDACYPDTLPPSPRPALALSAAASQGEYRSLSFAIRPLNELTDVSLQVSDLSDGHGHTIPSAEIERRHVRYMATADSEVFGSGVLTWKPRLLQSNFPIAVASQVTKQFWLTVHVPVGTPAGTYAGTVTLNTSAQALVLPLTVVVWPFQLDAANDMAYGWYYMSPDQRYCYEFFPDMASAGDDMLRLDFADMRKHGFNSLQFPCPCCLDINPTSGHVGTLDFTEPNRYLAAMGDAGFGGAWKGQVVTIDLANRIREYSSVSEFDTNFNNAYKDVIEQDLGLGKYSGHSAGDVPLGRAPGERDPTVEP